MRYAQIVARAALASIILIFPALAAAQQPSEGSRRALERDLRWSAQDRQMPALPSLDSIASGALTVPAGQTRVGPVVTSNGDLEVRGTVRGDVVAFDGNVVVPKGGHVTGDAVAVRGRVRLEGGTIDGETRILSAVVPPPETVVQAATSPWEATVRALQIAGTVLALGLALGFGVLLFAGETLDAVARTLETRFARSLLVGFLGELAIAPVFVLGLVALAISIVGILLIPFAAVVFPLVVCGTIVLGFLAVAEVTGAPFVRREGAAPRRAALRALLVGTILYLGLWVVAAAFTWQPVAATILYVFATIVTWVAVTAGFGAVILSRVGRRRPEPAAVAAPLDDARSWITPTPVGGVAAARRPTPAAIREPR